MRIVFASLGSLGDLHPLLALAGACREAGHDVVLASSEFYRSYVETLGYEFAAIRPDLRPDAVLLGRLSHPRLGPERLMKEQIFPACRDTYGDLTAACQRADVLVVGELLYVAPLVAKACGIPWANAILSPSSFLSAEDPCVLAPAKWVHQLRRLGTWPHRFIFRYARWETARWARPLARLRKELGLTKGSNPIFEAKHSPDLVLTLFPEFFAAPQSDWPKAVVQTGFPYFQQPGDPAVSARLGEFFAAGPAPVTFTLGSTAVHIARDFYQQAARAAAELGCRALLLSGNNPLPERLPDGVMSLPYAPLAEVLAGSRAVVHHGGIGSCAESLRAGLPSYIIPFGYDQPDNAERMRKLGVAVVGRRNRIKHHHLVRDLRILLNDPAMTSMARQLAARIHPEAELVAGRQTLEKLAAACQPVVHGRT